MILIVSLILFNELEESIVGFRIGLSTLEHRYAGNRQFKSRTRLLKAGPSKMLPQVQEGMNFEVDGLLV